MKQVHIAITLTKCHLIFGSIVVSIPACQQSGSRATGVQFPAKEFIFYPLQFLGTCYQKKNYKQRLFLHRNCQLVFEERAIDPQRTHLSQNSRITIQKKLGRYWVYMIFFLVIPPNSTCSREYTTWKRGVVIIVAHKKIFFITLQFD